MSERGKMLTVYGEEIFRFCNQHLDAKVLVAFQTKRQRRGDLLAAPFIANLAIAHNVPLSQSRIYVKCNIAAGCAYGKVDCESANDKQLVRIS